MTTMSRSVRGLGSLIASLSMFSIPPVALADSHSLAVTNQRVHSIEAIFVSVYDAENWGPNRLSPILTDRDPPVLGEGEVVRLSLRRFGDKCIFDVRIVDSSGEYRDYNNINVCDNPELVYD